DAFKDDIVGQKQFTFDELLQISESKQVLTFGKIENCTIEMTGHTGIKLSGTGYGENINYLDSIIIRNNSLKNIGGPGMVPGRCSNVLVQGNVVDHSGSDADPRMHNRGSGIWPWTCNNVLIEKNKFMHARGKNDSCGAHIDFNCNNVVVQYNLSLDNAGGFVEILGNDNNCCYRYNISIDDGFRIKGENKAQKNGHVLWTSGYVGSGNKKTGPFNSYIYNNTIYVKADILSKFDFMSTTNGVLIANNIFYIVGETKDTSTEGDDVSIENAVFKNNLYQRVDILPESLIITDSAPIIGDPQFANAGGLNPEDYIPSNASVVKDKGIAIEKIPGDEIGLKIGLNVEIDFFGNPISGLPDMGAVEIK
ncbi:MAG: right-handed parallel beta-helix repeat-containing protein, partial [Draconibacterium sp.]|nr:right-handed parallel beta-helix repeat-containing protein [Draconibacterium sp.]